VIDLLPAQLELVSGILAAHLPGREIKVFGSRADKGRAKPFSDLDLCLMNGAVSLADMARLADAFSESALPFKVDIVVWHDLTPAFRAAIAADLTPLHPR
jgi:predicted nucleotidyltransferase